MHRTKCLFGSGGQELKNKKKLGRTGVMMIIVTVLLLLANLTLGFLLTQQANNAMLDLIHSRMLDVAKTAAAMLDGDVLASLQAEDEGTEAYQTVYRTLDYFQDNFELKYIYTVRDQGNKQFTFIIDPSDEPGEFDSPVVYTDALYQASLGTAAADEKPYHDAWGTFYSAYTPVFTKDGRIGGIVAVDFGADWYEQHMSSLRYTVISVALVSLGIGVLIVVAFSRRSQKRYRIMYGQLNELAGKVEELVQEVETGSAVSIPEKARIRQTVEDSDRDADADTLGNKILSMQDELRRHIENIRKQAYLDGMTGVGNKTAYLDTVHHLDRMIQEDIAIFSVAVFDLNGLKLINDNYGHECGDQALVDAAALLIKVFGQEHVYRIGGDEFIAVLKESDEEALKRLLARLDDELVRHNQNAHSYVIPLAVSKGAAVYRKGEDADYKAVFKRADLAMYDDKRAFYTKFGDRRRKSD